MNVWNRNPQPARHERNGEVPGGRGWSRAIILCASGLGLVGAILGTSCAPPEEPAAVVLANAGFEPVLTANGRLEAGEAVDIRSGVAGRIISVHALEGAHVTRGEVLARYDGQATTSRMRSAEAAARAADEAVRSAEAEARAAELRWAELRQEHERIAPLSGTVVPAADVSAALAAADRAEADLARSAARVDQLAAQATAAWADVGVRRGELEDLEVKSPLSGVVVRSALSTGDEVAPGTTMFRIVDPETLYVAASFDESAMGDLRPGLGASVSFYSEASRIYTGHVTRVGHEVNPETREVEVEIALDDHPGRWAGGQRVDVHIETAADGLALSLPASFIVWREGRSGLFVPRSGRVDWVPVELGQARGDLVEITSGVEAGHTVLDPTGLRSGMRLTSAAADPSGGEG